MEVQPALHVELPRRSCIERSARRDARLFQGPCQGPSGACPAPLPAAGAGLTPNVAGALAYLVGAITGILFLVIDPFKTDRFVASMPSSRFSSTWPGSPSGSYG